MHNRKNAVKAQNYWLEQMQKQGNDDSLEFLPQLLIPDYKIERKQAYWGQFAETIEKFDEIRAIQLNQIEEDLKEIFEKKQQYLSKFIEYKSSILHQRDSKATELLILKNKQLTESFSHELKDMSEIVKLFAENPDLLSTLLLNYDNLREHNYLDFTINIMNLFYTHYFLEQQCNSSSLLFSFVSAIFRDWNYDIQHARMLQSTSHNDMVSAFFKHPTAECVIEKMAAKFIAELEIGDLFIFDLATIQADVEKTKIVSKKSLVLPQKESFFDRVKRSLTHSKNDQEETKRQQNEQSINNKKQVLAILKLRQQKFISVLRNSVQIIMKEQLPNICKLVLRAFKQKLIRESKTKQDYTRHYCYLLFSTWILSEFNIKFTMSHDEKGTMTNIDIVNVSQILRAITMVFQCNEPHDKTIFYRHVIAEYKNQVKHYYNKALSQDLIQESIEKSPVVVYQNCLKMFSLNDFKIFCGLVKTAKKIDKNLGLPLSAESFDINGSRLSSKFQNFKDENIYLMIQIDRASKLQQIQSIKLGTEFPLNQMPLITDVSFKSLDLKVEEIIQLSRKIQFYQKLKSKQILEKFKILENSTKMKRILDQKEIICQLEKSFESKIKNNLLSKSQLLRHRSNICIQINSIISTIDFYKNRFKNDNFYRNVAQKFVSRVKVELYVGIEENLLKVCSTLPQSQKKLHLNRLLVTQKPEQVKVMNSILSNSYKKFQSLQKIIEAVANTDVARKALTNGRRTQQFNAFFCSLCNAAMQKADDFLKQQQYIQHPDPKKFKGVLQERLGQLLLKSMKLNDQIERDKSFNRRISKIDMVQFYDHELGDLNVEAFLFQQAILQFNQIDSKPSAKQKIDQFDDLVKFIFSVTSLTISRQKITAQVITPIIQFVILKAQPQNCFKNLYTVQCLLGDFTPQTSYLKTLWTSAVMYLYELNQSPENSRMTVSCFGGRDSCFSTRNSLQN